MSFKIRLEEILNRYRLNPKKLGEMLGYRKPDKLYRLLNDESNNPSIQIIQDILKTFPEVNARWLVIGEESFTMEDPRIEYGFCRECLIKQGEINRLEKELKERNARIEELVAKCEQLGEQLLQANARPKAG
jgi:hypothetical protein